MCFVFFPILFCYYLFVWRNLMISFCEINRQKFPQHRYFVMWSLARASVRSSGGGGGGRELQENWVGVVCLDIKRFQLNQGIPSETNKKKWKKKPHPNIQTKFHTKTKIEKLLHQWQNSDQNGWKHLPFGVLQTYMAQNKCRIGVTEGPNLPPSLLFFLASFLWSFFHCEILRNVL